MNKSKDICQCGEPKKKYYWLHYFLSIVLFPFGLISLAFPLKKCRKCGLPYKEIAAPAIGAPATKKAQAPSIRKAKLIFLALTTLLPIILLLFAMAFWSSQPPWVGDNEIEIQLNRAEELITSRNFDEAEDLIGEVYVINPITGFNFNYFVICGICLVVFMAFLALKLIRKQFSYSKLLICLLAFSIVISLLVPVFYRVILNNMQVLNPGDVLYSYFEDITRSAYWAVAFILYAIFCSFFMSIAASISLSSGKPSLRKMYSDSGTSG
jgi:F0F1-type ATP synthase membrane subunit c/vacuolar-type H+-ATPase subunit K